MRPTRLYDRDNETIGVEEFRQVVIGHYKDLCLYSFRFVQDADLAKDIVQEVLTSFWNDRKKIRNKNAIHAYLRTAIKNHALNLLRKSKKVSELDQVLLSSNHESMFSEDPVVFDHMSFENLKQDYDKALAELPKQRRLIFEMSRVQQMSYKEIAAEMDISTKTVETQIYRSLGFLRKRLQKYL